MQLPYHLHTYGGVEEAVIRDWDDKMKENAEAYRERSYQRTQARLAEMNAQMAANRAVWLHARVRGEIALATAAWSRSCCPCALQIISHVHTKADAQQILGV